MDQTWFFVFFFFWVVGRDEDGELEMMGTRGWCGGLVINDQIGFLSLALLRFFFIDKEQIVLT